MVKGSSAQVTPTSGGPARRTDIYDPAPTRGLLGWNRLPAVIDSSVLLNDIIDAAQGRGGSLLLFAARNQIANLYATETIRDEIERHLERRAAERRVNPERACHVWRENYLSRIRFVAVEGIPRGRAARLLADRHPNDLPTAVLAELLAPCLVFASDKDLLDTGIARRDWTRIVHNAEEAKQLEMLFSGGGLLTMLIGNLGYEGARGVARLAQAAPLPTLVAAVTVGVVAHSHFTSDRGRRQITDGKDLAHDMWSGLMRVVDTASTARDFVRSAAFVLEVEPTDLAHAARAVAVAVDPLRASEVAYEMNISTQKAASLLRSPIFSRSAEGAYMLGRSYAPIDARTTESGRG